VVSSCSQEKLHVSVLTVYTWRDGKFRTLQFLLAGQGSVINEVYEVDSIFNLHNYLSL
jgi:hypothetical protein